MFPQINAWTEPRRRIASESFPNSARQSGKARTNYNRATTARCRRLPEDDLVCHLHPVIIARTPLPKLQAMTELLLQLLPVRRRPHRRTRCCQALHRHQPLPIRSLCAWRVIVARSHQARSNIRSSFEKNRAAKGPVIVLLGRG
jgi:hypothetical protein